MALLVIKGPGLLPVIAAAAILTAIFTIPTVGTWGSVPALVLAASVYGEIIRRVSRATTEVADPSWRSTLIPGSIPKLILCVLMAWGFVFPFWILNAASKQSPHFDWVGGSILAWTWIPLPLLMLVIYGRDEDQPLDFKGCFGRLARHPLATILAIIVVPMVVSLLELSLVLILYVAGSLPFFALDFMPMPRIPDPPMMMHNIPYYDSVDYRSHPESKFILGYFTGLMHGYSFVGAIPASLPNETRAGINTEVHGLSKPAYYATRMLTTFVINFFVLSAYAVQARWLGSIPVLDRKRSA